MPPGTTVIEGTPAADMLSGTNGADCILGYGSDDTIRGRGGDDWRYHGPKIRDQTDHVTRTLLIEADRTSQPVPALRALFDRWREAAGKPARASRAGIDDASSFRAPDSMKWLAI